MHSPLVYIVLVNYKNWQDTLECLESIYKLEYPAFKVVVVDNNSGNGSLEKLQQWASGTLSPALNDQFYTSGLVASCPIAKPICHRLVNSESIANFPIGDESLYLIGSDKNLGFAGGNNLGMQLALAHKADYVWLLNNDTVVSKDSMPRLVQHYQKAWQHKQPLGILGAKLLYYHNPNLVQALLGRYSPLTATTRHIGLNLPASQIPSKLEITENDYIVGASMFVSSRFIKEVGLMSEDYFLYYEELDWVKQAQAKGYTIDVCLRARVYHKEGASIGGSQKAKNSKSKLSDYYSIRNRLLITRKFYRPYLPSVFLSLIFVLINRVKRGQFSRLPFILRLIFKSIK